MERKRNLNVNQMFAYELYLENHISNSDSWDINAVIAFLHGLLFSYAFMRQFTLEYPKRNIAFLSNKFFSVSLSIKFVLKEAILFGNNFFWHRFFFVVVV